jgi:type VI secretion system secreted protein VgrG
VTHEGDAAAIQANTDFLAAYGKLAAITCPRPDAAYNLAADLTGLTLSPGVYCIGATALLTGQLILKGGKNAVWIFRAEANPSITAIGGSVAMQGGGQPCNVYWQTATNVSLDATDFLGNILAGSATTFTGVGSSLVGRALAGTAVTATGADITGCNKNGKPHTK